MPIRDRIKGLRRVKASSLIPNPNNPAEHSDFQRESVEALLSEVGFAGALIAYKRGGKYHLIDGHLRADISGDEMVPVLELDVTEQEAAQILATYNPLAMLAEVNGQRFQDLLAQFNTENDAIIALCAQIADSAAVAFEPVDVKVPFAEFDPEIDELTVRTFEQRQRRL